MATKTIKAWINGVIQEIEVEEMTSPEQGLSYEDRLIELEDKPIIADGNFLVGNGTTDLEEMTPKEVLSHIDGASVTTLTTAEYEAMSDDEFNANTLYMLTDTEEETIQSDWNQADETKSDYIKNKPDVLTADEIRELIDDCSSTSYIAKTVTLSANSWYQRSERDGFIYELEFQGMTTDAIVEVAIAADQTMMEEACRCGVICWGQEENYLLFKTMYDVPTIDIDVEILVFSNANLSTTDLLIGTGVVE